MSSKAQPAVLTIAGSDSSGGAGIQADLKTFAAHECYGTSAITALTAQNTTGVQDVFPSPPKFIEKQIKSICEDIHIKAIKTGMLFDTDNTRAVITALKELYLSSGIATLPPVVCDPVCVSTSGHTLLEPDAVDLMVSELFPLASLITPNKSEAELILSRRSMPCEIASLEDMLLAADNLLSFGSDAVLLKGGHVTTSSEDVSRLREVHPDVRIVRDGPFDENMEILQVDRPSQESAGAGELVVDLLRGADGSKTLFCRSRIESTSTHGTGCTLSAAIAAQLALGLNLADAVRAAAKYTHLGIETAPNIGRGHGPLNHLHSIQRTCIPRSTGSNPHPLTRLLIQGNAETWKAYVEHDFVKLLGKSTLPKEHFIHFIKQDYLYLRYYARAYALLAAKSASFTAIDSATQTILNVLNEINTHTAFCATFGISLEELQSTPESPATAAYGGYLLNIGLQGDTTALLMALLACLLGYGEVGLWLKKKAREPGSFVVLEGNPYLQWIEDYSGEHYQRAVKLGLATIEARAAEDPPSPQRFREWCAIWNRCTELEKGFWDMAMNLS